MNPENTLLTLFDLDPSHLQRKLPSYFKRNGVYESVHWKLVYAWRLKRKTQKRNVFGFFSVRMIRRAHAESLRYLGIFIFCCRFSYFVFAQNRLRWKARRDLVAERLPPTCVEPRDPFHVSATNSGVKEMKRTRRCFHVRSCLCVSAYGQVDVINDGSPSPSR